VNCVTLFLCNVRYYALYLIGHLQRPDLVSFVADGTNLPLYVDVPLNTIHCTS